MKIRKPRLKSLYDKLMIPISAMVILSLTLGGAAAYYSYYQQFVRTSVQMNSAILSQTATNLEEINNHLSKVAASLAFGGPALRNSLTTTLDKPLDEWKARYILEQQLKNLSIGLIDYEITILGINGLEVTSGNGGIPDNGSIAIHSPLFSQALKTGRVCYTAFAKGYTYSTKDAAVIAGCLALKDNAGKPYAGVFISFREADFRRFYENLSSPYNTIQVISQNGVIFSGSYGRNIGVSRPDLLAAARRQENGENGAVHFEKETAVLSTYCVSTDSYLLAEMNLPVLFDEFHHAQRVVLFLWLLIYLSLIVVLAKVIKKVLSPLHHLSDHMQSSTGPPTPVDETAVTELSPLLASYNHMVQNTSDYLDRLAEKNEKIRRYEQDLLQMQINPHFLYNTLGSVKHLIIQNEKDLAIQSMDSLVELLRSTLHCDQTFIPVEKEIENIRYYANIIEPRYGYQVVLKIHAEPETFSCEIPNLLLQPLVENAFFHGFQNSKRGKILLFLTMDKQKGDCLHCEIIDNGDGIEPELFRQIMNDSAPRKSSTRIGIRNIKERLELLYPGKSSFHITNEYGYGLSVEMIFPAHPDGGGQQLQREDPAIPS